MGVALVLLLIRIYWGNLFFIYLTCIALTFGPASLAFGVTATEGHIVAHRRYERLSRLGFVWTEFAVSALKGSGQSVDGHEALPCVCVTAFKKRKLQSWPLGRGTWTVEPITARHRLPIAPLSRSCSPVESPLKNPFRRFMKLCQVACLG